MELNKKQIITLVTVATLFTINILLIISLCFFNNSQQKIVTFDIKSTINLFLSQTKEAELSEEQIKDLTVKFNAVLDSSVKSYAQKHDVLILVKPSVVFGAEDVTNEIQHLISERMAK